MQDRLLPLGGDYMDFVYRFHNTMVDRRLILIYEGEVNQGITKAFATMAERNMAEGNETLSMQRKVYHVMVECLQNITKHADSPTTGKPETPGSGIFIVGMEGTDYTITTGNVVAHDRVEGLQKLLNEVNRLDKEELKAWHKDRMRHAVLSEKGGAGLGFIDIAKKTGNTLEYRFEPIYDKVSFFMLKTRVSRKKSTPSA